MFSRDGCAAGSSARHPVGGHEHDAGADRVVRGARPSARCRPRRSRPLDGLRWPARHVEQLVLALALERGDAEDLARRAARTRRPRARRSTPRPRVSSAARRARRRRPSPPAACVASVRCAARATAATSGPSIVSTICASPPSGGTSAPTSTPSRSTVARSHIAVDLGQAVGDEEHRAALRRASARMIANTRSARSAGSAAVISSSSSSCGSQVRARARSSMRSVGSGTSWRGAPRSTAKSISDEPAPHRAAASVRVRRRFWATVRSGTSAGSWKTGARPSRAASHGEPIRTCVAVDRDRPRVGADDAGQHLDERALAGAVGAEQRVHLARPRRRASPSAARRPAP